MRNPTHDECTTNAPIDLDDGRTGYACWYPQMGGYVSHCVVVEHDGCFEAFVWHDGDFPFVLGHDRPWPDEPVLSPSRLHHCDADQFVRFGETVGRLLFAEDAEESAT